MSESKFISLFSLGDKDKTFTEITIFLINSEQKIEQSEIFKVINKKEKKNYLVTYVDGTSESFDYDVAAQVFEQLDKSKKVLKIVRK